MRDGVLAGRSAQASECIRRGRVALTRPGELADIYTRGPC